MEERRETRGNAISHTTDGEGGWDILYGDTMTGSGFFWQSQGLVGPWQQPRPTTMGLTRPRERVFSGVVHLPLWH
jgi:hypothetical protein